MTDANARLRDVPNPDAQVVLLLCGRFGNREGQYAPLATGEYNRLAQWLQQHEMRPQDLLGSEWLLLQGLPLEVSRVRALFDRGVALALALEHWTNQGIWVLARSDTNYPLAFKERLKAKAPPSCSGQVWTERTYRLADWQL